MKRRTFLRGLIAIAASVPLLGLRSMAKRREESWDPDLLKQPGWEVAFVTPGSEKIASVTLDGREIRHECFAVNESTGEAGCYLVDGNQNLRINWQGKTFKVLRRGVIQVTRN